MLDAEQVQDRGVKIRDGDFVLRDEITDLVARRAEIIRVPGMADVHEIDSEGLRAAAKGVRIRDWTDCEGKGTGSYELREFHVAERGVLAGCRPLPISHICTHSRHR